MKLYEARDVLFGIISDLPHPIVWTDTVAEMPVSEEVWLRASIRHATGNQDSLSCENGTRRWRRTGTFFVQVFDPVGGALSTSYEVAEGLLSRFQNFKHAVMWLRQPRIAEIGYSGNFHQLNVSVTFDYDDYGNL